MGLRKTNNIIVSNNNIITMIDFILYYSIITMCACASGKVHVIGCVVVSTKITISRCLIKRLVCTMNQSHLDFSVLWIWGTWSTSIINSAFLLAFVTMSIDSAHSMHYACRPCHARSKYYELVKVVNNASGICLAASHPQTGMQSTVESEYKIPIST